MLITIKMKNANYTSYFQFSHMLLIAWNSCPSLTILFILLCLLAEMNIKYLLILHYTVFHIKQNVVIFTIKCFMLFLIPAWY